LANDLRADRFFAFRRVNISLEKFVQLSESGVARCDYSVCLNGAEGFIVFVDCFPPPNLGDSLGFGPG